MQTIKTERGFKMYGTLAEVREALQEAMRKEYQPKARKASEVEKHILHLCVNGDID